MQTQVEELPEGKVRLDVEVPTSDIQHAIDHAASDLAGSLKIPGFRKGKVPMPVLMARVGRERLLTEAVESHIRGWFWDAAARSGIRPVAQPEFGYELPESPESGFRFSATVAVQQAPEVADWAKLEVPKGEVEVPAEAVEAELEALRFAVAELAPADGRPAKDGDVVVLDLVPRAGGDGRYDFVAQVGDDRLLPDVGDALRTLTPGESTTVQIRVDEETTELEVTLKEVKERVLAPLDDELARSASEFDTLEELRRDVETRMHEVLSDEVETAFREAAVDKLAEASNVEIAETLVAARATELLRALERSLAQRGLSADTYLSVTGQNSQELQQRLLAQARQSLARELVLEGVADKLGIEISDAELRNFARTEAEAAGDDDPAAFVEQVWESGNREALRADLRLRHALDRVVADVQPIPLELAQAREKLWTPEKEKTEPVPKLWTPGRKEPA
jgi:trigger factor